MLTIISPGMHIIAGLQQKWWENLLPQNQLCVLTLILVSVSLTVLGTASATY